MFERAAPWVSFTLCAVLLAGCGAGSHATAESDGNPTATSTTAPAPTTTTVPPPYSFDGSVPPPPLLNTGTDYEAIFRSLDAYSRWLLAHHPNPEVLVDAYTEGTSVYERFKSDLAKAQSNDLRVVDVNDRLEVSVLDVKTPIVSLRVVETLDKTETIARDGSVADEASYGAPLEWLTTLHLDTNGRWRIASAELADRQATVSP